LQTKANLQNRIGKLLLEIVIFNPPEKKERKNMQPAASHLEEANVKRR
jgi:hypothetical protein